MYLDIVYLKKETPLYCNGEIGSKQGQQAMSWLKDQSWVAEYSLQLVNYNY